MKAAAATVASVAVSVSIVLLLVPMLGGQPDGPGFWMSVLCPLLIAGPASTWQFHQTETIARQRDAIARMHVKLEDAHAELQRLHADLGEKARTDALTGGLNRGAFFEALEEAVAHGKGPMALIVADADHFKTINDGFGHLVGDEALRRIGGVMADTIGSIAIWGRIGGEEFAPLLADTGRSAAIGAAERQRLAVAETKLLADERPVPLSVSIGIACANAPCAPIDLFRRADDDLYRAKSGGRNRIVIDGREVVEIAA
jgi:diguanylate cyclase (GGDEF)-like protein